MQKILVGFRTDPKFKELLQQLADEENRTLSGFLVNAILTYIKETKGLDWKKERAKQEEAEADEGQDPSPP